MKNVKALTERIRQEMKNRNRKLEQCTKHRINILFNLQESPTKDPLVCPNPIRKKEW